LAGANMTGVARRYHRYGSPWWTISPWEVAKCSTIPERMILACWCAWPRTATWPLDKNVRTWAVRSTIALPPGGSTVRATKGFLTSRTGGSWLVRHRGHCHVLRWKEEGPSYGPWAKHDHLRAPTAC